MVVDTVTPSAVEQVDVRQADPDRFGFPGEVDLNTVDDWRTVSSFIHPNAAAITYDKGAPSVDIGDGKVFRVEGAGRFVYYVGAASGLALADSSKNYVYFTENKQYVSKTADQPEHPEWLLAAVIDTAQDTVQTLTRGRRPIPEAFVGDLTTQEAAGAGGTDEHVDFTDHEVTITASTSQQERARYLVQSDEQLYVERFGLAVDGGGTPGVSARLYDVDENYEVVSVSAGSLKVGDPIATSGTGSTVVLEVTNTTSTDYDATIQGHAPVVAGDATVTSSVIEDWERPNPVGDYSGDTGAVTLVTSNVKHRSTAAEVSDGGNFVYSLDGGGLPNYPDQGQAWEYYQRPASGDLPQFAFGVQGASNYYLIELDESNDQVQLAKVDGGTRTNFDSDTVPITAGAYHRVAVEWTTGNDIYAAAADADGVKRGLVSVTSESTFTDGGVGWGEGSA